jgi:hypothetical protein
VRPGGKIALNFRSWSGADPVVLPVGVITRGLMRVPGIGNWMLRHRTPTRLAWQANRLDPHQVVGPISEQVRDVVIIRNPARKAPLWGVGNASPRYLAGINRNHWWLVATVR